MTIRSLPTALEPYLSLPAELSLTLITGTLGCTPTWLVTRHIASFLQDQPADEPPQEKRSVILISYLHDTTFWSHEIRRTTGLNPSKTNITLHSHLSNLVLPSLPQPVKTKTLLILDSPSLLLSTTPTLTPQSLNTTLLALRSQVHSTLLLCNADLPLLPGHERIPTPLETGNAAFLTAQAHLARRVMSVRELETGAARDVSGVLSIARGGDATEEDGEEEFLYLVQRDGSVKVFGRGE